ncbi:MAG: hypothetical protein L0Y72_14940 [Gemmataceae bacterium]|nr:hypothetical protein [Gemmataceae bacterium]MCI0740339.1 hypothetical protein [Gemmataceae bacterium]
MQHRWIYFFGQGQADGGDDCKHLVGGKGASLAEMTKAGLNVPPGFTISAECCDLFYKHSQSWPDDLRSQVESAMTRLETIAGRRFGQGANPLLVAVRSGAAQSMPGMMDTLLNAGQDPNPWRQLEDAITDVFRSWSSDRAVAFRKHHKIDGLLGTAVNVQMMCPSEVAGILFTANPVNPALAQMIIESSFGLGEAIVLGKVTPDRFVVDRHDLRILERHIARKADPTPTGESAGAASLTDAQIEELARLGQRVEEYFKHPCDIEWGFAEGQFYLLQSRAIKFSPKPVEQAASLVSSASSPSELGPAPAEVEKVRQEEIAALKAKTAPGGTVWARFNLAEILPEPTPMTWSIVRRFMSGQGGFGLMYRDLGFDPDPALDEEGIFDLVCGRPYCNLSREPRMQYRNLPFEHKFELLKANPAKALYPQAVLNPARASWKFWLFLPGVFFKLWRSSTRLKSISKTFADDFQSRILPAFVQDVEAAEKVDVGPLSPAVLVERIQHWIKRVLVDFARDSLKPTALAGIAMGNLERTLAQRYQATPAKDGVGATPSGLQLAQAAIRELVMGVRPTPDADLPGAIRSLAAGRMNKDEFIRHFGHRGSQEMELAQPRWQEEPKAVEQLVTDVGTTQTEPRHDKAELAKVWESIAATTRLLPSQRAVLEAELETLHQYLALRETAKHHLMRGYALIRRLLVELDERFQLDSGVFFLTLDELPRLAQQNVADDAWRKLVAERRRRREIALSLATPQVLFSDDLEALGRDVEIAGTDVLDGVPLSAGTAEGPVWVVQHVVGSQPPSEPYILVCPSTDPAWVPLLVNARGLVMETGGVLSHGAIVAREFGLPAVAGIADAHRRLKTGQRIRVDGASGKITVLS